MVARAFAETSGKPWSRTSPRPGDDAEVLGAFAGGNVSVRTEAGVGAATCEVCGCAAVFFPAAVFSEFCVAGGADFFWDGGVFRRARCSDGNLLGGGGARAAGGGGQGSGPWRKEFGKPKRETRNTRKEAD